MLNKGSLSMCQCATRLQIRGIWRRTQKYFSSCAKEYYWKTGCNTSNRVNLVNCAGTYRIKPRLFHTARRLETVKNVSLETPILKRHLEHCIKLYETANKALVSGQDEYLNGQKASSIVHELKPLVSRMLEYQQKKREIQELILMIEDVEKEDKEMAELAVKEREECEKQLAVLDSEILAELVPEDRIDHNDIMLELSAGVGGLEAMLFTQEIYDMYRSYAAYRGWQWDTLAQGLSTTGGMRSSSVSISGQNVYQSMKFEAGTHRVQRVPKTEKSGRVHTSTMTVAVLPQPSEIDIVISAKDLKVDTFRASGAGGQHVNTTDSAVRITHLPSGIVAECQAGRSQIKNKDTAMTILRTRLYEKELEAQTAKISAQRKLQTGSKARSEKIRTYNFSQDRITDHRIGKNMFNIEYFLSGGEELYEMIELLLEESTNEKLIEKLEDLEEEQKSKQNNSKY